MKRQLRSLASRSLTTFTVVALGVVLPVRGGVPLPFATEITQILNNVQLINQYVQQVQQYTTQLQQYRDQLQHTLNIPNQLFGAVQADLQGLAQIVVVGQGLAYSMNNLNGVFTARFPGYGSVTRNFGQIYRQWGQTSLDTALGTLRAAGLQGSQLLSEQNVLNGLRQMSGSSQGRMQAIQVGVQVGEQQVEQLMKLRALMLADLQSKAVYQSAQLQKDLTNQANSDAFFGRGRIVPDGVLF